jgi:hypothetical protein
MRTALAVASGLLAISTTASADGYLGLGVGTQPAVNDSMAAVGAPSGRSLRGLIGFRFGNVAVEGAVNGFGVATHRGDQTVYQASAALKLSVPFGNNFEGFGRAGLERTWLNLDEDRYNLSGDGFLVSGGFEYRLNAVIANASIFVDYTIHHATLEDSRDKVDATSRVWGLGFTVGI